MNGIEEAVFTRYGLLGLVVIALITFGPRFLDRMTAWAVKHAENEDRADEKIMAAFTDELKGGRLEREAYRLEREQYLAMIKSLEAKITLLDERLKDVLIAIRDFDDRMKLYIQNLSKGKTIT